MDYNLQFLTEPGFIVGCFTMFVIKIKYSKLFKMKI